MVKKVGNPNIGTSGKRFSKDRQPVKNGRKPTRMAEFIKAFGMDNDNRKISKEDAYKLLTHLLSCSKTELQAMGNNPDLPVSIICQIKAIVTDIENGRTDTVDKLFDRLYAKEQTTVVSVDSKRASIKISYESRD